MSNTIYEDENWSVCAFVGKEGNKSIQFTIRNQEHEHGYSVIQLNQSQVIDLCILLLNRVNCNKGYCATD